MNLNSYIQDQNMGEGIERQGKEKEVGRGAFESYLAEFIRGKSL